MFRNEKYVSCIDENDVVQIPPVPANIKLPKRNRENVPIWEGPISPYTSFGINKDGPTVLELLRKLLEFFVVLGEIDYTIADYKIEGRCYYQRFMASFIIEILATPNLEQKIHIESRRSSGDIFAFDYFMHILLNKRKEYGLVNESENKIKCSDNILNNIIPTYMEESNTQIFFTELLNNIQNKSDDIYYDIVKTSVATLLLHIESNYKSQITLLEIPNSIDILIKSLNNCEDVQMIRDILKIFNIMKLHSIKLPINFKQILHSIENKWKQCIIEHYGNIQTTKVCSQQIVIEAKKCLEVLVS